MIRLQEMELVFGQTHRGTQAQMDGRTHRLDVGNSILDVFLGNDPAFSYFHNNLETGLLCKHIIKTTVRGFSHKLPDKCVSHWKVFSRAAMDSIWQLKDCMDADPNKRSWSWVSFVPVCNRFPPLRFHLMMWPFEAACRWVQLKIDTCFSDCWFDGECVFHHWQSRLKSNFLRIRLA